MDRHYDVDVHNESPLVDHFFFFFVVLPTRSVNRSDGATQATSK